MEPVRKVIWRADLRVGPGERDWRPLEVDPFTRYYDFDVEQAAIDKARQNDGDRDGFRIRRLEIVETVEEFAPHRPWA